MPLPGRRRCAAGVDRLTGVAVMNGAAVAMSTAPCGRCCPPACRQSCLPFCLSSVPLPVRVCKYITWCIPPPHLAHRPCPHSHDAPWPLSGGPSAVAPPAPCLCRRDPITYCTLVLAHPNVRTSRAAAGWLSPTAKKMQRTFRAPRSWNPTRKQPFALKAVAMVLSRAASVMLSRPIHWISCFVNSRLQMFLVA